MATNYADIHIKVDKDIKQQSEAVLSQIGISMSDLINMTLRRVIFEQDIPFSTKIGLPKDMIINTKADLEKALDEAISYDENSLIPHDEIWSKIDNRAKSIIAERRKNAKVRGKIYA